MRGCCLGLAIKHKLIVVVGGTLQAEKSCHPYAKAPVDVGLSERQAKTASFAAGGRQATGHTVGAATTRDRDVHLYLHAPGRDGVQGKGG